MPALVQVDDDRHRVLDLLFDGVEWVLHRARSAGALRHTSAAWPSPVRSWAANAQDTALKDPLFHISLTTAQNLHVLPSSHTHNTALATRSTPRQDHPYRAW